MIRSVSRILQRALIAVLAMFILAAPTVKADGWDSGYNHDSFCDYVWISMDAYMGSGAMFGYGDYVYIYGSYTQAMNIFVHSGCAL